MLLDIDNQQWIREWLDVSDVTKEQDDWHHIGVESNVVSQELKN